MPSISTNSRFFIGLMSGTSLDGVDGVIAELSAHQDQPITTLSAAYLPFPPALRSDLLTLQASGPNEIHQEALAANSLARLYAECVNTLLKQVDIPRNMITAIGAHGQTIRHRPEYGYTRQTNNPALLAELTGIDVIADFRARDIAAGGQGAPLVPAFHQAIFGHQEEIRVVVNIGGISNISVLEKEGKILGFDTGPGNVLMDAWIGKHQEKAYDHDGTWAAIGKVIPDLLNAFCNDSYFSLAPPKSTGRDLFHLDWLISRLNAFPAVAPADVQATLLAFTATTIVDAIIKYAPGTQAIYVCGGGAYNTQLMLKLQDFLIRHGQTIKVSSTDALGISPNHVEALAFAWLAHRYVDRKAGNLSLVTGAKGSRILGALYPA